MKCRLCFLVFTGILGMAGTGTAQAAEGARPYELDWAGRVEEAATPLVDFEDLAGWRVECRNAEAVFQQSAEQRIWGQHVGKLAYKGLGAQPEILIKPAAPVPVNRSFDAVTLWCFGNNWGYSRDPSTPPVEVAALFSDPAGREFAVAFQRVNWKEWHFLHRRLAPADIEQAKPGTAFLGLRVRGGTNAEERILYFDNFSVRQEEFPALSFQPRAARGIDMLPGVAPGTNTGPGRLPFPTRPETILPPNLAEEFATEVKRAGDAVLFSYLGPDGGLTYTCRPAHGTWDGIEAEWTGAGDGEAIRFRPCVGGGARLWTKEGAVRPERAESLGEELADGVLVSRWRLTGGGVQAEVTYRFRIWNKSLVIDVLGPDGNVGEVAFGRGEGLVGPRLVTNPFYPGAGGRPAVAVSGPGETPLFLTGNVDWYLSNASVPWAENQVADGEVAYNGGTRYLALTDGRRNPCAERFFVTVSPKYEEVLPVVANPPSPWRHVTGTRVWRAHAASNRERDAAYWENIWRHGLTELVVTDHETMWRDGGESFTFRTRAAPGKGGDEGARSYSRWMQDRLGFVYGPYNNYTDMAPVNEFFDPDLISRTPENQLQTAWMRCYAPKPARAVEFCEKLAPVIEEKFGYSTAYCDVHTCVSPWSRVDYDPRVPGAGTFAAVFYSYGEIMLLQKKAWDGPVYSEGQHHCFYMGLTDGNYGQDQAYRPAENPWLVDFDLRRLHDLGCNFGMGNPEMFYTRDRQPPRSTPAERDAWLDRFLAATVAFGHPGFLVTDTGMGGAFRSYYMLQQLAARYCLASADRIRYADSSGRLLETAAAVGTGAYRRSQVVVSYRDGTTVASNGHPSERLRVSMDGKTLDLPPNGYAGWTADGAIEVESGERDGVRCDFAAAPAYLYVDGRGRFARFSRAAGNGPGVCRLLGEGRYEVICLDGAECGFDVKATRATALDKSGKELGPAELRQARGLTYVRPVEGAFSYLLEEKGAQAEEKPELRCARDRVVPGERVQVTGHAEHAIQIPANLRSGARHWVELEGGWIDFTVVPLAEVEANLDRNKLSLTLQSGMEGSAEFQVRAGGMETAARLESGVPGRVEFELGTPRGEEALVMPVELRSGEFRQDLELGLVVERRVVELGSLPETWRGGICLRGGEETGDFGTTRGSVRAGATSCGGVEKKGLAMHPPYQGGTGYVFAEFDPVDLPAEEPCAFRAWVGKGDGSDLGDGILYRLLASAAGGPWIEAGALTVKEHRWEELEADLSRWAGGRVGLKLVTDAGEKDNSSGDWACWSGMRIESLHPVLLRRLESEVDRLRREPAPVPMAGLKGEDLRSARAGWLRYEGKGLAGTGQYRTLAALNGVDLGEMAPASGDEQRGIFSPAAVKLNEAAIRTLGCRNLLRIHSPGRDSYSVRRFWIELELANGAKCSSEVSTATFTQPGEWLYAEGIGVGVDGEIGVDVWFAEAE